MIKLMKVYSKLFGKMQMATDSIGMSTVATTAMIPTPQFGQVLAIHLAMASTRIVMV